MRRRLRRPPRRGMTLLEVLLALAIFLLSLGAILSLIDFGVERGRAAAMQSTGTRLASSKLAEAEAGALDCKAQHVRHVRRGAGVVVPTRLRFW